MMGMNWVYGMNEWSACVWMNQVYVREMSVTESKVYVLHC